MRILRNLSRETIITNFNTRTIVIAKKATYTTDNDKEADYLLQIYGFLRDETPAIKHKVSKVKKAYGAKKQHGSR